MGKEVLADGALSGERVTAIVFGTHPPCAVGGFRHAEDIVHRVLHILADQLLLAEPTVSLLIDRHAVLMVSHPYMIGESVVIDGIHMVADQTIESGSRFLHMEGMPRIESAVEGEDAVGVGEDIHLAAFCGCESLYGTAKPFESGPLAVLQTEHAVTVGSPRLSVLRYPKEYRQRIRVNGTGVEIFQGKSLYIGLIEGMLRQHIGRASPEGYGKNGTCLRGHL